MTPADQLRRSLIDNDGGWGGRPVAEILGWTEREVYWVDESDAVCSAVVPFGPDGERRYAQHGPTIDDLLAWLGERVKDWRAWPTHNPKGRFIVMVRIATVEDYFDGMTLREAIEDAVRYVSALEEEDES